ncbi:MAG: hypothetical protein L0G48_12005 [Staphylococcus equorum]|uniref:hypothetical protein n=1 Tax=Acinetobacter guillouiae TaxID=106649 RepID=UPI0002CD96F8|nr:hypothetical protein [Acinetobacter guillouiae]MDN5488619.1 hypothetical protein [Lactococcus lactis]MDN5638864.1 hypothetical protein [Staphylococcus equorum]ENU59651.1 hypothetical protein F981_01749 [Acinetobacter guillouiae CIP 63.46]EPH33563.1 hypothetical protein L291_2855 [Acinetobacter guillouiae MSP4-18]KAB0627737.1 hypothetical protein F7P82_07885 [Acinetobacter guillouiae]
MSLSVEQKTAIENYAFGRISEYRFKKILDLDIENNQTFGADLFKLANDNKEEFALAIGMGYLFRDGRKLESELFSFIKKIYFSEWHHEHENIIDTFSRQESCEYIDFLYEAIIFVPQYLVGFEERSIARRAFFGFGRNISCPKALEYLNQFLNDPDPTLRGFADEQFKILGIKV